MVTPLCEKPDWSDLDFLLKISGPTPATMAPQDAPRSLSEQEVEGCERPEPSRFMFVPDCNVLVNFAGKADGFSRTAAPTSARADVDVLDRGQPKAVADSSEEEGTREESNEKECG